MKKIPHYIQSLIVLVCAILTFSVESLGHGAGQEPEPQCITPVGETLNLTIHGGRNYAEPGEVYGFDVEIIEAKRCQKVEVTFINTDKVRHAFMVDGLSPMFMIEIPAQGQQTASFIAPDKDVTLLLHCHVPGHERAGMRGMTVIGNGDNDFVFDNPQSSGEDLMFGWLLGTFLVSGMLIGGGGHWMWRHTYKKWRTG